ncbi:MAG: tRNA modification GTPase [Myxococcaceae bacterium]|nr:tRNA modification GTPase [Myxococcaceae bacterium]
MFHVEHATIIAIATGAARAGIGVIRISGPRALLAARRVAPTLTHEPPARRAVLHPFLLNGRRADEGLVIFFPGPRSFTGEDVVELQAHGAPRLLQALVERCLEEPTVRLAESGEFTRRALLSGRLDLTRAEAVLDLIEADTEAQVLAAADRLDGGLAAALQALHVPLVELVSLVDGLLDFPDEAHGAEADVGPRLVALRNQALQLEAEARRGARLRQGARVVLFGPPNAGKSTLFNRLVGADRAIVDPEPGTTRDALEARIELRGALLVLADTAGLREGAGRVEQLGIEKTRALLQSADLGVLLAPAGSSDGVVDPWRLEVPMHRRLDVGTRADVERSTWNSSLQVSGLTGAGVPALLEAIADRVLGDTTGAPPVATERHLEGLTRVREALDRATARLGSDTLDLVGTEAAVALAEVGRLLGLDVERARLDALFSQFCIGK